MPMMTHKMMVTIMVTPAPVIKVTRVMVETVVVVVVMPTFTATGTLNPQVTHRLSVANYLLECFTVV